MAIPAVLLYPFGFFALFVQFTGYFDLEFYTAWYAASLANRMLVIGLGATILIVPLVGSLLFVWVIGQILCRHGAREGWHSSERLPWLVAKLALVSAVAVVLYVVWSRILAAGRVSCLAMVGRKYDESSPEALRHQLDLWPDSLIPAIIFVLGGLLGGVLVFKFYRDYRESVYASEGRYPETGYNGIGFFGNGVTQGWLLPSLVTVYFTGIVASLVLVGHYMPAFMPFVTYGHVAQGSSERPTNSPNRYLSQAEGRWHVIHRYRSEGERWYGVLALPEENVKNARVVPISMFNPRVASLPGLKDADENWCGAPPPPASPDE